MKKLLTATVVASLWLGLSACSASAKETVTPATVKQAFIKRYPKKPINAVNPTPVAGVYELVLGDNTIVYADAKVNYLFTGEMIDANARESLTEKRMAELNKVDFAGLPLDKAVKEVRGNGKRKLVVFSDPDCPFCKKLERETLAQLDNVTIYTLLYPITSLHPQAMQRSAQIWCSSDRTASWLALMRKDQQPTGSADCPNPLADIQQLGERLGINGTPTLVLPDGRMVSGAVGKDQLEKLLASQK